MILLEQLRVKFGNHTLIYLAKTNSQNVMKVFRSVFISQIKVFTNFAVTVAFRKFNQLTPGELHTPSAKWNSQLHDSSFSGDSCGSAVGAGCALIAS